MEGQTEGQRAAWVRGQGRDRSWKVIPRKNPMNQVGRPRRQNRRKGLEEPAGKEVPGNQKDGVRKAATSDKQGETNSPPWTRDGNQVPSTPAEQSRTTTATAMFFTTHAKINASWIKYVNVL